MSERGFIAVARGILDHHLVGARKPYSRLEAWQCLLLEAAWKRRRIGFQTGRHLGMISLERGQLSHSLRFLAKKWGWSVKRTKTFLVALENDHMITTQTDIGQTIITICNYNSYQLAASSEETQTDTQRHTQWGRNGNKEEEGNKDYKGISVGEQKSKNARAYRLPDDWQPTADDIAFARSLLPEQRIQFETEKFRDYWHARAGNGAVKCNWAATWRNWCRKASEPLPSLKTVEKAYAETCDPSDWRKRRNRSHGAIADLHARADRIRAANGGSDPGHGTPLRLVSDARRI
jgi:hypothetical protein